MDLDAVRLFIMGHPILAASLSSLWGAIVVDLLAFKGSKDPGGFFETFSFKIAAWRYLQAFVGGFVGNVAMVGAIGAAGAVSLLVAVSAAQPAAVGGLSIRSGAPPATYGPRPSVTCPAGAVSIAPGQNIQAAVNAADGSAMFCLRAGVHPITSAITPKSGQTFVGEFGAILDGSTWTTSDSSQGAFRAHNQDIDNVTIRNLVIRNMPQKGIHAFYQFADRWTIEGNEIAGAKDGVLLPNHAILRGNFIHHNVGDPAAPVASGWGGGYGCYMATDVLIEANEIAYNGYEQKCLESVDVVFRNNYLHHNQGDGIWYDGKNTGAIVEGNRAELNGRHGIDYEGSLGAVIRGNTVIGNGENGFFVSMSQNVDLYGNVIAGNKAGGIVYFLSCGTLITNPGHDLANIHSHDNSLTVEGGPNNWAAGLAYTSDCTPTQLATYHTAKGLRFTRNLYDVPVLSSGYWLWNGGGLKTWAQWQAFGMDLAGGAQ